MMMIIEPPHHLCYANKPKAFYAAFVYRNNRIARRLEGNVEKIR